MLDIGGWWGPKLFFSTFLSLCCPHTSSLARKHIAGLNGKIMTPLLTLQVLPGLTVSGMYGRCFVSKGGAIHRELLAVNCSPMTGVVRSPAVSCFDVELSLDVTGIIAGKSSK